MPEHLKRLFAGHFGAQVIIWIEADLFAKERLGDVEQLAIEEEVEHAADVELFIKESRDVFAAALKDWNQARLEGFSCERVVDAPFVFQTLDDALDDPFCFAA